jgi:hypothetical protein
LIKLVVVALAVATLLSAGAHAAASAPASLSVYFLQLEQMIPVRRPGSTVSAATTALLAGPTKSESAR